MTRICAGLLPFVVLTLGAVLTGQQPVFRSTVDLVTVDAIVVDRDGRPLVGLTRDDFELVVDGRPRRLEAVEFVRTDAVPAAGGASATPPDTSSNDVGITGRLVLLVVDRANIRMGEGGQAMTALARVVAHLSPEDRVGLYTLPRGGPQVGLTSDRQSVIAALQRVRGLEDRQIDPLITVTAAEAYRIERRDPVALANAIERNCIGLGTPEPPEEGRAGYVEVCGKRVENESARVAREMRTRNQETLEQLEALLEAFRHTEGPKTILYVSEGLPLDDRLRGRLREFGKVVAASAISLYAVQLYVAPLDAALAGLRPDWDEDRTLRAEGLSFVTGMSGGALLRPGAGVGTIFEQIGREMSARYVLSFQVAPGERDGHSHNIAVKLRTSGARVVRHRTEFSLEPKPRRFVREVESLSAALSEPLPVRTLPLRVGTYIVPEAASSLKVLLAAEIGQPDQPLTTAQVAFEIVDGDGRRVSNGDDTVTPRADGFAVLPLRYTSAVRLAPGRYRLKLAARIASGHIGSVEHPFVVAAGGDLDLALGSLMLFRAVADGDVTRPELVFDLSRREPGFGAHLVAHAAHADVFSDATAVLEVTDQHQVTRFNRTMSLVDGPTPEQKGFETRVATGSWPPGTYAARVTVVKAGQTLAHVSRTISLRDDLTAAAPSGAPVPTVAGRMTLEPLLARSTEYVREYADHLSSTVAEEQYVQVILEEIAGRTPTPRNEVLAWRDDPSRARARSPGVVGRRQLRSDLLMVRTSSGWYTNYRDVAEVDGRPVKDRDERALALFTAGGDRSRATLARIAEEGARHNLGNLRRTINVPTLPLFSLHPRHVQRFAFEYAGEEVVRGASARIVRFRERHAPTFITTPRGDHVFTAGRLWLAVDDGRVLRTGLDLIERQSGMRVQIDVDYGEAPNLGLLMPIEMRERYSNLPGDRNRVIEGRATYENFRKFAVVTEEQMK